MATTGVTVPELIDIIWMGQAAKYTAGESLSVNVPMTVKPVIGQHGIKIIADRFKKLIGSDEIAMCQGNAWIMMYKPEHDGFFTKVAPATRAAGKAGSGDSTKRLAKIPRPPNAFILYRKDKQPLIKGKHPDYTNNRISVILGKQWKLEADEVKDYYINLASDLKDQHMEAHPGYSYQPRKPTEKKRRMTAKKAEKLNSIAACLVAGPDAVVNGAKGSEGVVPCVKTNEDGDLEIPLNDKTFDADTLTNVIHSTNMANMLVYGNACGKIYQGNSPQGILKFFNAGGYEAQGDLVANYVSDVGLPIVTKPLQGLPIRNLDGFVAGEESTPVLEHLTNGPSYETQLFFDQVFDLDGLDAEAFALNQKLQTQVSAITGNPPPDFTFPPPGDASVDPGEDHIDRLVSDTDFIGI